MINKSVILISLAMCLCDAWDCKTGDAQARNQPEAGYEAVSKLQPEAIWRILRVRELRNFVIQRSMFIGLGRRAMRNGKGHHFITPRNQKRLLPPLFLRKQGQTLRCRCLCCLGHLANHWR